MSVQTEIDRIISAVDAAHEKVAEKGGTTARPYLVGNLAAAIDTIPAGGGAGGNEIYIARPDASFEMDGYTFYYACDGTNYDLYSRGLSAYLMDVLVRSDGTNTVGLIAYSTANGDFADITADDDSLLMANDLTCIALHLTQEDVDASGGVIPRAGVYLAGSQGTYSNGDIMCRRVYALEVLNA